MNIIIASQCFLSRYFSDQGQIKQQSTKVEQNNASAGSADDNKSWQWQTNGLATNGPVATEDLSIGSTSYPEYYVVNQQGQLIKHSNPIIGVEAAQRVTLLETELIRTQNALAVKTAENEKYKLELNEAYALLDETRQQQLVSGGGRSSSLGVRDSTPNSTG